MTGVLSVDPGKASGWAWWSNDGVLVEHGILQLDEMMEFLSHWPFGSTPEVIVYENFILDYRARKQVGSRMEASQVIGALKVAGRTWPAICYGQPTDARDMGYVHAQLDRSGRHAVTHDRDAVAHGFWWFEAQGVQPTLGAHGHLRRKGADTGVVTV